MAFMIKSMIGNPLDKVPGVGGGDDDKAETNEEGEDPEVAEQRALEEEKRKDKHRKIEEEREGMRQVIRDKYRIKKKEEFPGLSGDSLGRPRGAPGAEGASESSLPPLPGNLNEHLGKVGGMATEMGSKVTEAAGAVGEKCSIQ